ncbi:hypothetical protein RvY_13304 [Ramazzottius varieornatus]|uniref:Metalloendopeptidase n=1 Tax=Ramazzottius varieornatus TaxID=947166 RepID=A0A1D1VMD5_RAMVA|nr:hypothetical protein RvY_13304 [Ramazzottius varieornatus]
MAARAMINVHPGYGFFLMALLGLVDAGAAGLHQMLATDTILPRPGVRTVDAVRYWPFGRMPYAFTDDFPEDGKLFIRATLQDLMNKTKVKIIERIAEKDYALVTKNGAGCSAVIGRQAGAQLLTLAVGCYSDKMPVLHEFLHAYGMNHEHVRPDRDQYVEVN